MDISKLQIWLCNFDNGVFSDEVDNKKSYFSGVDRWSGGEI